MGNEEVDLVTVVKPGEKRSLLKKYDIPVENLSYEYIARCTNAKELERIVLILRSGEEGIFPDLIKHAEKCVRNINPKSKVLRVEEPALTRAMLEPEDRKIIDEDIAKWMSDMQGREKDLEEGKMLSVVPRIPHPEIRQMPESSVKKVSELRKEQQKEKSIASCDYRGWDKFDADAELDRIDLQDERKQIEAKNIQQMQREKIDHAKKLSREAVINKLTLTATELSVLAEQEKNIGNEAYRSGDWEEALIRYNSSITINSTVNAYNNRAITNIKLQRYQDAVNDCNVVLSMEYNNVTALMRRGLALECLEKNAEALMDYQTILQLEPNNKIAIAALNKLRKSSDSKKVRMKIEETEEEVEEKCSESRTKEGRNGRNEESDVKNDFYKNRNNEICFCDRAPGFSQNPKPPPHYKSSYCISLQPSNSQKSKIHAYSSKSQNSYFSDVKITKSNTESSKLIIEELPNDESISKREKVVEERKKKPAIISDCIQNNNNNNKEHATRGEKIKKTGKQPETLKPKNHVEARNQQKKVHVASKYEKSVIKATEFEKITTNKDLDSVESPYEFLHLWQSLKKDENFSQRAQLLRSLKPEDLNTVIGNKLDGSMFSVMLRCLERHFCNSQDVSLIHRFLTAFTKLSRFSIVHLFMDIDDKEVLKNILNFIEGENSPKIAAALRQTYNV